MAIIDKYTSRILFELKIRGRLATFSVLCLIANAPVSRKNESLRLFYLWKRARIVGCVCVCVHLPPTRHNQKRTSLPLWLPVSSPSPTNPLGIHPNMTSDESSVKEMDAQIARSKFSAVLRSSILELISEGPSKWNGPLAQDYLYEQSLIERNTKPIIWGVGCTVVSFVCFRLNASRTFQQFRRRYIRSSAPAPAPLPPQAAATSPLEQRKVLQSQLLNQAISIPIDLLLSIALGVSATAFLMDYSQIQRDLERVPGLPGRSVLADTMCPNVIQLYNTTPSRVWNESDSDATLQSMVTIVKKCQRRAKMEAAERQRLGLTQDEPVSIPFPGFI